LNFFFLELDIFTTFPLKVLCFITLSHIALLACFIFFTKAVAECKRQLSIYNIMMQFTIIIGTRRGYRKVFIRGFSSSMALQVNANDGRNIDRSSDIANEFRGDRTGLDTYFRDKEESIKRDFIQDSETGAADGVSANELES
jgi:hypothetical protein